MSEIEMNSVQNFTGETSPQNISLHTCLVVGRGVYGMYMYQATFQL